MTAYDPFRIAEEVEKRIEKTCEKCMDNFFCTQPKQTICEYWKPDIIQFQEIWEIVEKEMYPNIVHVRKTKA